MLADLGTVLAKAQRGRYAVGSFNTANLELTQAILAAAEAARAPVIVSTTEKAIAYGDIEVLAAMIRILGARAKVPVVLNLDHGHHLATVRAAIRAGYTGVMYDASTRPYRANARQTKTVVRLCHRARISVEGELGSVGGRADLGANARYTDPHEAAAFVRDTGVDALAVMIGNAHGGQFPEERLRFDLLTAIRRVVRVPLVLHGASETPAAHFRQAIRLGITKVNIDTTLRKTFTTVLRRTLDAHATVYDPRAVLGASRAAVQRVVKRHLALFGSAGKV
ncbi:MAG: class II fructose-bisphosphate aldolase family protein [Candidatus Kerfeldbacteria bacterium]|nr:class II fructose-bisphosphate aldolase family protein [Candidatus Kerfeldbacteria bacterium]